MATVVPVNSRMAFNVRQTGEMEGLISNVFVCVVHCRHFSVRWNAFFQVVRRQALAYFFSLKSFSFADFLCVVQSVFPECCCCDGNVKNTNRCSLLHGSCNLSWSILFPTNWQNTKSVKIGSWTSTYSGKTCKRRWSTVVVLRLM